MNIQRIFENWNNFKSDVLIENILNEISYEFSQHVEDWLADNGGELNLPFNDLFDGKTRTVIPLGPTMQPGSKIYRLIRWLEEQGYDVDFGSGLVTKEFESYTGNPNDPNTKKIMRKKQQKIGKVLQRAAALNKRIDDSRQDANTARQKFYADAPPYTGGARPNVSEDEAYKKASLEVEKAQAEYKKHFKYEAYGTTLYEFNEFWNKESRYFRENPEEMMTDYSVVISRHPVDVLRMSDHRNISSCHSEGNSHFHCAVKEAKGAGSVAYIVETADLDQIDLEDGEIFEDDDRGVDGIEPVGRVRLRRFDKTGTFTSDNKYSLLMPEKRIYGQDMPGFYEAIRDWALEAQKDKWAEALVHDVEAETDENPDPMKMDPDYLRDFVMKGGSYQDTNPRSIFMAAFADYGGRGFEHAEGGRWQDTEGEEERIVGGIDALMEQIDDEVHNLEMAAERHAGNVDEGGVYIRSFSYEVIDPDSGMEWSQESSLQWAEDGGYEGGASGPRIQASAECVIRAMLNGPNWEDFPSDWRELQPLANDVRDQIDFYADHGTYSHELSDYELEEDSMEAYVEFIVRFDFHGRADDYEHFCDSLAEDEKSLGEYRDEMISVLQQSGFAKPTFTDLLRKDVEEERQSFSKFILRPDNTGGYTLTYPMHGDPMLPDDFDKEKEVVMQIPAGRMPTKEILHGEYGDVRNTGTWRVKSYISPKFTRQVIRNMAKLFAQAHMSAKKQLKLPLQEGEEQVKQVTAQDIEDYIAMGFTLALADVDYERGSGTKQSYREYTPETGTPRQTTLAIVRFVLDDEPHHDFTIQETEELFKAALNFVKMLDEDISLLTQEVTGVLQTLSPQQEGGFAKLGIYIKEFLKSIDEMVNKVDQEIFQVAKEWGTDPEKNERLNHARLPGGVFQLPDNHTTQGDGRMQWYYGHLGTAFETTPMSQFMDDRVDIARGFRTIGRFVRSMDSPGKWRELTPEKHKEIYDRIYKLTDEYNRLQTVEELSRLFESAPTLMKVIREEIISVLQK
jgi:hypothetical protein